LSGTLVQASARNPLAEPGLLGITGGAGLGAVIVTTIVPGATVVLISTVGIVAALLAFGLVYALAWRGGMTTDRLVLVGIGMWYGFTALTTLFLIRADPWDTPALFTWLSGSTYGRVWADVAPVALVLVIAIPLAFVWTRELDLLALDDDTPRLVGVAREPIRLGVLITAAVLAAVSVSAVGVVGFIGLVAPHAARALVGARHRRVMPVAMLLGAGGLIAADTLGPAAAPPAPAARAAGAAGLVALPPPGASGALPAPRPVGGRRGAAAGGGGAPGGAARSAPRAAPPPHRPAGLRGHARDHAGRF